MKTFFGLVTVSLITIVISTSIGVSKEIIVPGIKNLLKKGDA